MLVHRVGGRGGARGVRRARREWTRGGGGAGACGGEREGARGITAGSPHVCGRVQARAKWRGWGAQRLAGEACTETRVDASRGGRGVARNARAKSRARLRCVRVWVHKKDCDRLGLILAISRRVHTSAHACYSGILERALRGDDGDSD